MTKVGRPKQGKIALVTGAGRGLGYAYATRLASEGATVIAVDNQDATSLESELKEKGAPDALFGKVDVAYEEEISSLAQAIMDRFGRCDIIVNNVGMSPQMPIEATDLEMWRQIMAVNVESMFLICRALLPSMKTNRYGRIVNISSNAYGMVIEGFTAYIASKGAVIGFTRALASEVGTFEITVNAIAPGMTRTPHTETTDADSILFEQVAQNSAVKRVGVTDDLVGVMSFLTSDDCEYVTSQTMIVDGGLLRAL